MSDCRANERGARGVVAAPTQQERYCLEGAIRVLQERWTDSSRS